MLHSCTRSVVFVNSPLPFLVTPFKQLWGESGCPRRHGLIPQMDNKTERTTTTLYQSLFYLEICTSGIEPFTPGKNERQAEIHAFSRWADMGGGIKCFSECFRKKGDFLYIKN